MKKQVYIILGLGVLLILLKPDAYGQQREKSFEKDTRKAIESKRLKYEKADTTKSIRKVYKRNALIKEMKKDSLRSRKAVLSPNIKNRGAARFNRDSVVITDDKKNKMSLLQNKYRL